MHKLSTRHFPPIYKISKRDEQSQKDYVNSMKSRVKKDPAVIDKFEEYGIPIDEIDNIHVEFKELDVSAKTKDRKIYLNKN